jgi:hypothetical protein
MGATVSKMAAWCLEHRRGGGRQQLQMQGNYAAQLSLYFRFGDISKTTYVAHFPRKNICEKLE